jgi:hypothetical protein
MEVAQENCCAMNEPVSQAIRKTSALKSFQYLFSSDGEGNKYYIYL